MKMQRRQTGFTLIEMIAVIVILGILAAVALPKFMNMSADARIAKMKGAVGAVNTAASLFHSKWLANPDAVAKDKEIEGYTLKAAPTNGYPAVEDIAGLAGIANGDFDTATAGTIKDMTNTSCSFTYAAPAAAGGVPNITTTALTQANCS